MIQNPRLKVLAPTRYPWRFNSPRLSVHEIEIRSFLPLNKLSSKIEGITVFNPLPIRHFDLIHAFNRIPLGPTPFVIGFESHLPRAFGWEATSYFRMLSKRLASERCRKIIAISRHAADVFRATHRASPYFAALNEKLIVRYPNLPAPPAGDPMATDAADPLIITFVGNHFARKGGCVGVRMAEKALARGFPLIVQIVSKLEMGADVWTDPPDSALFEPYLKLLGLPNVRHFPALPNRDVLALLRKSHFSILATFSDTFGYSAIESMMNYTPVIATRQGALPEFIRHGENGIMLDLPVSDVGEWSHRIYGSRTSERYKANYVAEIERLAEEALGHVIALADKPNRLRAMRENARQEALVKFDHQSASLFWDALYTEAAVPSPRKGARLSDSAAA